MSRIDKKDCTEEKKSEPKRFYGLTMPSKILVVMDEYKDMLVLSCPQHGESKIIIPKENSRS